MKKIGISVVSGIVGMGIGIGIGIMKRNKNKNNGEDTKKVDKFKSYYYMINEWLKLKQSGKNLEEFFITNNYCTIAIYGMGEMGNRFYSELKESSINVKYAIDKIAVSDYSELKVVEPDEYFEEVDAIVVTAIFAYEDILEKIKDKVNCPIISLEEVVCGVVGYNE